MHKCIAGWIAFLTLLSAAALSAGTVLPKADRLPAILTSDQANLIKEGVALHGRGDYDGAIARYRQVLEASPDAVSALHELAYSYYMKKDYENALKTARQAAEFQSPGLASFHTLIANVLDDMGKREEALATYRAAIKQTPREALLHFNLAMSLIRAQETVEAKKELQRALVLNPKHPGSHYQLAALYARTGYEIPALLALSRFLLLEPASDRAANARAGVREMLSKGAKKGDKDGAVTIMMNMSSKSQKDEGDFDSVQLVISMDNALGIMKEGPKKDLTPFEDTVGTYRMMAGMMSRMKPNGFAARYYAPFFAALAKDGFLEAFVSVAFAQTELGGAAEWSRQHEDKLRDFPGWLETYRWPAK